MKKIKIAAAFIAALLFSAPLWAQQTEQLVVPLSEPGKPFQLHIGLISGSIKVVSYAGKDVVIDVQSETDKRSDKKESSGGMKKINTGRGMDVTAEEKNNNVNINSQSWKGPVNFTIKVPQSEAKLKLSTINEGDISVSDVSGEMEISNVNGPVTLSNVSGSAVVNTVNGDVKVNFKSIDPKAAMAFSSLNGNVDVTFPASFKANVKLKSDQGDIYSDFDITADPSQPKVNKTTSKSGTFRINIESWVYGKINAGGPELMMKNMNGNIYIRKAK